MFEQGPQTISTDPGPSPFGCQSPSQADGSGTRKDGFQAALPFGSSPHGGPLGMAAWRGHHRSPGHRCIQARLFVQLEHESGSKDGLPRSLRPLPQKILWKRRGQNNSRVTKSYYGKSDPFTGAGWLCRLRQKQLLSRQQLLHGRVHWGQKDRLEKTGKMEADRCGSPGKGGKEMGHKGGPVLLLLLSSAQSLSPASHTRFKGMKTTGYTALAPAPGVKQGQGTRKEDTTSSPTGLSQPGNKKEGRTVGCVKTHEQQGKYSLVCREALNPYLNSNWESKWRRKKSLF